MPSGRAALSIVRKYYPNVQKVVDAKRDVEIQVSENDSRSSRKKSPNACALATACERNYDGAIISMSVAYLIKGDKAIRFKVPQAVSREIVSFDRHSDFAPGEYRLNAPSEAFKMGPRKWPRRHREVLTPGKQGERKRQHRTAGIRSL